MFAPLLFEAAAAAAAALILCMSSYVCRGAAG